MHRVGDTAEDRDEPVALDRGEHVEPGVPGRPAHAVHDDLRLVVRWRADDHRHRLGRTPAERGGPRAQRLVGLAAHQGVDDHGLEPGVPGAACLGRLCVHLGGGEGDLAGVDEDRFAQFGSATGRGDPVGGFLDRVDGDPYQLDGLLQAHRPGELARRRAEDLPGDLAVAIRMLEPLDEGRDAGLSDEADPRTALCRHGAVPGERLLHPPDRGAGEVAGGALQGARGRRAGAGGGAG